MKSLLPVNLPRSFVQETVQDNCSLVHVDVAIEQDLPCKRRNGSHLQSTAHSLCAVAHRTRVKWHLAHMPWPRFMEFSHVLASIRHLCHWSLGQLSRIGGE